VCGVSAKEEGIYFGVKYFEAEPTFTIQLGGKNFLAEKDVKQLVLMQFDRRRPSKALGTGKRWGDDSGLQFGVDQRQLRLFMKEFRQGRILRLRFPESRNPDWTLSLTGTSKVSEALLTCIDRLRGPGPQSWLGGSGDRMAEVRNQGLGNRKQKLAMVF
jgi:hypothetical protein